jgi:hypothetical protein
VPGATKFDTTGLHTARATIADRAGNAGPEASRAVLVDATTPRARLTCPPEVAQGATASAALAASDVGSGLATPVRPVRLATTRLGTFQAGADVRDRVGHTTSASCSYVVVRVPRLVIGSGRINVARGRAPVSVNCPRASIGGCRGTLVLSLVRRRHKPLRLGQTTVRVAAGKRGVARVRLDPGDLALIPRRRTVNALLTFRPARGSAVAAARATRALRRP